MFSPLPPIPLNALELLISQHIGSLWSVGISGDGWGRENPTVTNI